VQEPHDRVARGQHEWREQPAIPVGEGLGDGQRHHEHRGRRDHDGGADESLIGVRLVA